MTAEATNHTGAETGPSELKSVGIWLAAVMAVMQAANVVRVLLNPAGFAQSMGLPLTPDSDPSFIYVYGLRTAFIALLIGIFVFRRDTVALMWMALAALLMPIGDVILTFQADAAAGTVARHAVICGYVLITYLLLRHWNLRHGR